MNLSDFTTEQLEQELENRGRLIREDERVKSYLKIKNLNLKGVTVKNVVVHRQNEDDGYGSFYSFYLTRGRSPQLFCFYYDWFDFKKERPLQWWPAQMVGTEWQNDALQFVPQGFSEAAENSYEFRGTHQEALAVLAACGITRVKEI